MSDEKLQYIFLVYSFFNNNFIILSTDLQQTKWSKNTEI